MCVEAVLGNSGDCTNECPGDSLLKDTPVMGKAVTPHQLSRQGSPETWGWKSLGERAAEESIVLLKHTSQPVSKSPKEGACLHQNAILGKLALGASLVTQTVKNLPVMQETWV